MFASNASVSWVRAVLAALLLAFAVFSPAMADQTDPALNGLFDVLQSTSDPAEAQAADQEIWRRWTESGDDAVDRLMQTGLIAMHGGQLAAAEAMFGEIIALRPDFAEAWNKRATVRYFTGNLDGSIADCARVLALEERHYGAMSGMGLILVAKDDMAEALQWFERALAVNPHMAGVRANIEALRKELKGRRI